MRAGCVVRLRALDRAIDRVTRRVAALGLDDLRPPASGGWGPLAIVEHLVLVHEGTLWALERAGAVVPPGRVASWWRPFAMPVVLRSRLRIRAPTARILPSPTPVPLQELTGRWRVAQGQLWRAVADQDRAWGDQLVFRHPLAGWLDVAATLQFLIDHIGHHDARLTELQSGGTELYRN